jgi:hypothetical protein
MMWEQAMSGKTLDSGVRGESAAGLMTLVKGVVDRTLAPLFPVLVGIASSEWDLDVRPSVVLRAVAFKALVAPDGASFAREPEAEERLRWFLDMNDSEHALDLDALDEGERRLISNAHARQFVRDVVSVARARATSMEIPCSENAALIGRWTETQP